MLRIVNEDYLAYIKGLMKYEIDNNPQHAEAIKKWRSKHIKEIEEILNKEKINENSRSKC